jgi:hypothetical protein
MDPKKTVNHLSTQSVLWLMLIVTLWARLVAQLMNCTLNDQTHFQGMSRNFLKGTGGVEGGGDKAGCCPSRF